MITDNIVRPSKIYVMEWMGADWIVEVFWYGAARAFRMATEVERKTLPRAASRLSQARQEGKE